MKKRIIMAMLAAMMVVSNTTPVLAAADQTNLNDVNVGFTTNTKDAIYRISVPSDLKMYLDPFQLAVDNTNNYIVSDDFVVTNKSNIAVQISAKVTVTGGDGVTIKDKAEEVTETDDTKLAYVEAQIPTAITEEKADAAGYIQNTGTGNLDLYKKANKYYTSASVSGATKVTNEMVNVTGAKGDYTAKTPISVPVTLADGATLPFLLQAAKYTDYYEDESSTAISGSTFKAVEEDGKSTAVFRLSGKLNTEAKWATADLTASVTYSIKGLAKGKYDEKVNQIQQDGGHVYMGDASTSVTEAAPTFASSSVGVITYTEGSGELALDEITSITVSYSNTNYEIYKQDRFAAAVDDGNGTITINSSAVSTFAGRISGDTISAKVTYKNVGDTSPEPIIVELKLK